MGQTLQTADSLELEQIIREIVAGDEASLALLFGRTGRLIRAIAYQRLRCNEDAEEVALDVLTHVWTHAALYDPFRGGVVTWLSAITRNKSIDRLRRRRRSSSFEDIADELMCESIGPEGQLMHHQDVGVLQVALATLSPVRRRVVMLAYFEGHSHHQIAHQERLPLGTVKSHARRALLCLREQVTPAPLQYRVGGELVRTALPHNRTCGSASGGSI